MFQSNPLFPAQDDPFPCKIYLKMIAGPLSFILLSPMSFILMSLHKKFISKLLTPVDSDWAMLHCRSFEMINP